MIFEAVTSRLNLLKIKTDDHFHFSNTVKEFEDLNHNSSQSFSDKVIRFIALQKLKVKLKSDRARLTL